MHLALPNVPELEGTGAERMDRENITNMQCSKKQRYRFVPSRNILGESCVR
jgi:hypothetical protein